VTVLVIDVGSSSVRALLFDDQARPVPGAVASRSHSFTTVPPGAATADAIALRDAAEACMDEVLQHPGAREIRAVGMDTFVGNVLGVDHRGVPVTPMFTYADTRSADDVAALKTRIDGEESHQRTGCILHTAYQPGRLLWLRRTEPFTFAGVNRWIDIGTYLYTGWFGESAASYSVASWSGMFNRDKLDWDEAWLYVLEMGKNHFPELADYNNAKRGLRDEYAKRWPALRDVPFCLAVGDGAAANVGSGCVDESHIALTVGTTAALRVVSTTTLPPVPPGLWSYRADAAHHLIGGATTEGGNIFQWARDTLKLDEDVEAQLASREPDAHGLTFLPLLAGERSPGWATHATGAITGLRLSTTPLDILQAALEGVALRLSLIADQLGSIVQPDATIIAGGGALVGSPAWAQMIAHALNRPIHITEEPEITARGVAILTLVACGRGQLADYPPAIDRVITPNPEHAAILREARERQVRLYHQVVMQDEKNRAL